jgi:hypothetical protein
MMHTKKYAAKGGEEEPAKICVYEQGNHQTKRRHASSYSSSVFMTTKIILRSINNNGALKSIIRT